MGSNSTLVAPVEIGDGAYLAAGSVITDPVPAGRSGAGPRPPGYQEGWARKRREQPSIKMS